MSLFIQVSQNSTWTSWYIFSQDAFQLSSFSEGGFWHEKMECNRLEGSDHESRRGSHDAVRSSRSSEKGRKRLVKDQENLKLAGPDTTIRVEFLSPKFRSIFSVLSEPMPITWIANNSMYFNSKIWKIYLTHCFKLT